MPPGDYGLELVGGFANSSRKLALSLDALVFDQRVYDGHLLTAGGTLRLAAGSYVSVQLGYSLNRADLPGGAFTGHLGSLRLGWSFSTRLTLNALLQYDSLENQFFANLRLNFIHRPGSDLYVVLNEEHGSERTSLWQLRNRGLVVKLTYLARF